MADFLYTSAAVKRAIIELFERQKGRRVAVSAFVGEGAEKFLPRPRGLELVCWPRAGGTNPRVLRNLIKRGAKVRFADRLHMKVYWSEGRGAVITSANLSNNAMGSGDLREVGVRLPAKSVDINLILARVRPRNPTRKDFEKLWRGHRDYNRKNDQFERQKDSNFTFADWLSAPGKARDPWKVCGWSSSGEELSQDAKEAAEEYDIRKPSDWYGGIKIGDYKRGDYVLVFKGRNGKKLKWFYVDYVAKVRHADAKSSGPRQIVQYTRAKNTPPPFKLDRRFRAAFSKAISTYKNWERLAKVPGGLLNQLARAYR